MMPESAEHTVLGFRGQAIKQVGPRLIRLGAPARDSGQRGCDFSQSLSVSDACDVQSSVDAPSADVRGFACGGEWVRDVCHASLTAG